MNNHLTDYDEETTTEFVRGDEELYHETHKKFEGNTRKDYPRERFTNNYNLSVKVSKTWFESQRTNNEKLTQSKVWPGSQKHREAELDSE